MEYTVPVRELDEDLWPEILKRLHTKSVFRFRCVCKRWNSIISSAFFMHLYFTFNLSATPHNLKPYLHVGDYDSDIGFRNLNPYFPFQVEEVGKDPRTFTFIGVIHAVVCMVYYLMPTLDIDNDPARRYRYAGFFFHWIFLWNSSIHKYVALPRVIVSNSLFWIEGFGYDASTDDFKITLISQTSEEDANVLSFDVFSARQGFWRSSLGEVRVDRMKEWSFWIRKRGCFANGTVHWLVYNLDYVDNNECCIMMFDCESEKVTTMDFPEQVSGPNFKNYVRLFEYAGMLATLVNSHGDSTFMSLWVIEEHGVSTSWKKLYTVNPMYPDLGGGGLIPCEIIIIDPSFEIEKRVPYGPSNLWRERAHILGNYVYNKSLFLMDHPKARSWRERAHILDNYVYNKSLFLMDHPKARSYTYEDVVHV